MEVYSHGPATLFLYIQARERVQQYGFLHQPTTRSIVSFLEQRTQPTSCLTTSTPTATSPRSHTSSVCPTTKCLLSIKPQLTSLCFPHSVTGASRGIGLSLITSLLKHRPDAIIFAGARDPSSAHELAQVAEKHPNVHVVPLIADDEASVKRAVEEVRKVTKRLDIVVANAGESDGFSVLLSSSPPFLLFSYPPILLPSYHPVLLLRYSSVLALSNDF